MIFDWDDLHDTQNGLDRFYELKEINPGFRATVFAIPGLCSEDFLDSLPHWLEVAVHGWVHPDPYECSEWTHAQMEHLLDWPLIHTHFVRGFKAPGWQISQACYDVLLDHQFWVADQSYNDHRRPEGIYCHLLDPDARPQGNANHWHGHIQDVCGNGIEETWEQLAATVRDAQSFELVSERTFRWQPLVAA